MASFGRSAGDIIATLTLVNRVIQCVGGANDARKHFQELISELEGLSKTLSEISEVAQLPGQVPEIEALKFAACSCGDTLQRFYTKIQPFENSLGATSTQSKIKAAPRMVRWELLVKKDVPELRSYLVAHVGALNLRLSAALLKESSRSQMQAVGISQKQDAHFSLLQRLTTEQAMLVERIGHIPTEDTVPKLESLITIAINVWKTQNEILHHLSKASHSVPNPDLDHTWAQAPVKFEDALGRRFVIPSEYDWDKLEAIVQAQFKNGPGSTKVRSGEYELFYRATGLPISQTDFSSLIPRAHITMTIILGQYNRRFHIIEKCTRFGCCSSRVRKVNFETMTCMECQSIFRKSYKPLCRPMKPMSSETVATTSKIQAPQEATSIERRDYKNLSIYFVELPATPQKFRDKYPRDYVAQMELLQNYHQLDKAPTLSVTRKPSLMKRLFQGNATKNDSDLQMNRQRNAAGLRSMLQRHISRTPLARLNFNTSAQERYSSRRSKKELSDLGRDHNPTTIPQSKATSQHPASNVVLQPDFPPLADPLRSRGSPIGASGPEFWTPSMVSVWLTSQGFSSDWVEMFSSLNIYGSVFLELGSGNGGRGNFGMMHQLVYPELAKVCSNSGTGWDQAREREEGKRLRRLIRKIVNTKPDLVDCLTLDAQGASPEGGERQLLEAEG